LTLFPKPAFAVKTMTTSVGWSRHRALRPKSPAALSASPSLFDATPFWYSSSVILLTNFVGCLVTLVKPHFHYHVDLLGTGAFAMGALIPLFVHLAPVLGWLGVSLPRNNWMHLARGIPRIQASTAAVVVWSVKLASFLWYRVLCTQQDARFNALFATPSLAIQFWMVSATWGIVCSLPHLLGTTSLVPGNALVVRFGTLLYAVGWLVETLADYQKWTFKQQFSSSGGAAATTTAPRFCNVGLWSISQHPNWLGNLLLWCGIFLINATALIEPSTTTTAAARVSLRSSPSTTALSSTVTAVTSAARAVWRARRLFVAMLGPLFLWTLFNAEATGSVMADSLAATKTKYGYGIDPDYTHYIDTTPLIVPNPLAWWLQRK
jgi:steroid 5-alpha reductase family enzyme